MPPKHRDSFPVSQPHLLIYIFMREQRGASERHIEILLLKSEHVDTHVLAAAREAQLHAPPGDVSSITFGPGGLGTVEVAVNESEKATSAAPAAPLPPRTGAYTSSSNNNNNNNNSGNYDYAPPMNQKSGTLGGYNYGSAATPSSSYGSYGQNNNRGEQYGQHPAAIGAPPTNYGAGPPISASHPLSSSSSACSSRSWGSQPPLTSSKRDQNWERKRRQWLARKNSSAPGSSMGRALLSSGGSPPGSSYGGGMMPMNPYMEDHHSAAAVYAPPSPLSKFVYQQSQKKQQQGGFGGGGYVDYERISTAQSQSPAQLPLPPYTGAAYNDSYGYSGGGSGFTSNYNPISQAIGHGGRGTSSGEGMSHPHQAETDSSYGLHYGTGGCGCGGDATPASRGGTAVAGVSTSGGYAGVAGNGNTANRNVERAPATGRPLELVAVQLSDGCRATHRKT